MPLKNILNENKTARNEQKFWPCSYEIWNIQKLNNIVRIQIYMVKQEKETINSEWGSEYWGKRKGWGSRRDEKLMFCFQNEVSGYLTYLVVFITYT